MSLFLRHLRRVANPRISSSSNLRELSSISQNDISAFDVKAFESLVLYEDQHILVVNKPTGMLSQGDSTNDASMFSLSRQYLAHIRGKEDPTSVYLGLVHRYVRTGRCWSCKPQWAVLKPA
jgi:23S rRNA-/tRNA-specific pseudouridylate synthase